MRKMSDNTSVGLWAIQQAMFNVLSGYVSVPVYDRVPPNVLPPYVTFGDMYEAVNEARGVKGRTAIVPLRVHVIGAGGKYPAYKIMGEIVELLTVGKLSMTGWNEIWKTYREGNVVKDKDDTGSYLGVVTFIVAVAKS